MNLTLEEKNFLINILKIHLQEDRELKDFIDDEEIEEMLTKNIKIENSILDKLEG